MRIGRIPAAVVALALWVGTALVGLWEIVIVRDMLFRIYAFLRPASGPYSTDYWVALSLGNWLVLFLSVLWLGFAIGTGEYHYKRVGQRASWRLFGWTVGIEVLILLLALII